MKTGAFQTNPEPVDSTTEDEARDLRLHYHGLAHFFAAFEPRPVRHHAEPIASPAGSPEPPWIPQKAWVTEFTEMCTEFTERGLKNRP